MDEKQSQCELKGAEKVLVGQYTDMRASQCDLNEVGPSTYWYCLGCGKMVLYSESPYMTPCREHAEGIPAKGLEGLILLPDFVDEKYESELVSFLDVGCKDRFEGWKVSQSGRNKHDFGPQPNFKKKKVKVGEGFTGVPKEYAELCRKVEAAVSSDVSPFIIAQYSALEYLPESRSYLNPHIDDTWLWGERVVGLSLLSDCRMTFITKALDIVDVPLPRRALFVLSGASRYDALHGIRTENVESRRISITIRELSPQWISESDPELVATIRNIFKNFV